MYASLAPREHYAFIKIAQYFPALNVIGRVDLLFAYVLTVVLFLYTCLPLFYATDFTCKALRSKRRIPIAVVWDLLFLAFAFYCNKYYNAVYALIGDRLSFLFPLFAGVIPTLLFFLIRKGKKEVRDA